MLKTPLTKSILRTTDNYIKALEKGGISTVFDMLRFFPREYEDRSQVLDNFSMINLKEKNTILVTLVSLETTRTGGNKLLTKAIIEDKNGFLAEAVWFNRKYLASQLKAFTGKKILLSGKVKYNYGKVSFNSPEPETDLSKIAGGIVPIYSDAQYIPGRWIESKMGNLESYISDIPETLPEHLLKKYNFISRKDAFHRIHFPKNSHDVEVAKIRLAYEELYNINYTSISQKHKRFDESEGKSPPIPLDADYVKEIFTHIPFDLTGGQKVALFQVLKDMEKNHSMQRLLEGDVGTGKTIVSLIATIHAIKMSEKKPHLGISSPQGEEGYSLRQGYSQVPDHVKALSKELREKQTSTEEIFWQLFRNRRFHNLKFRRQHAIGRYIADFYCDEKKLVVELDGKIHEDQKEYDQIRDELIQSHGIKIIRINNEELGKNIEEIYSLIQEKLCSLSLLEEREFKSEVIKETSLDQGTSKIQVAIMAPTEILARQHFASTQNMLIEFGLTSHLLVGSTKASDKKSIKADLRAGNVDVIIGTHALVQEDVFFANLGFVIIDEQHRFGVHQRGVLESGLGNLSGAVPHNLNMTATPIPRTLALTLYGDQDLSIIREYPKGRKEIHTKVAKNDNQRQEIELFVRNQIEQGRQVFWVSPLVEESEKIDLANAVNTYETLQSIYAPFKVGLIHGKMKAKEKEAIMQEFVENKIQILSSTTVIEVGVDVPNATIMCIEGAERFGLSSLHQIRGRVGRGAHQSYCYLFPTSGQPTDRLKAMERTNDGFELSEIDLEIRGPGEVYGVRQSGIPDLKIADISDLTLVSQIREDIEEMFETKDTEGKK